MRVYSWFTCAVLAGIAGSSASPPHPAPARVFASFSSEIRGEFPPSPCGVLRGVDEPGLSVEAFDEVTHAGSSTASGSFEIDVATTCVAPFYQALFAHEALRIRFAFADADRRPAREPLVLVGARLTHVDVVGSSTAPTPYVRIGISASEVREGDSKATPRRQRAESYRGAAPNRFDEDASGEAWVRGGVDGVSVRLASAAPPMTAAFVATDWNLSVNAPRGPNGSATSTLRLTLDPGVKIDAVERDQLFAATDARAGLTHALFEVVNARGTSGITIRLKGAAFTRVDRAAIRRTIELAASQLTVTDLASGRTASTPWNGQP